MDPQLKRSLTIGTTALLGALVLFGGLSLYEKGYRFDGIRLTAPGTVTFSSFPEDAVLRVGEREVNVRARDGIVVLPLKATTQKIIVSKEGYWPWEKEIVLQGGEEISFGVFLMRKDPVGAPLPERDPLRKEVDALLRDTSLPARTSPVISEDGTMSLFVEGGRILARRTSEEEPSPQYFCSEDGCAVEHVTLSFDAELRDLSFYPGRSDVAMLAIQNGIFALELDNRGTQNFQPIYRGTRPRFVMHEGVVYLKEGQALLTLSL